MLRVMNSYTSEQITIIEKQIRIVFVFTRLKFSGSSCFRYFEKRIPRFRNLITIYVRYENKNKLFTTYIMARGYKAVIGLPFSSNYGKLITTVEVVKITNSKIDIKRNTLENLMNLMSLFVTTMGSSLSMLSTILIFSILNIK